MGDFSPSLSSQSSQKSFSWLLVIMCMLMTCWLEAGTGGVVHAATGQAQFSMAPTQIQARNATSRSYFVYASNPGAIIDDSVRVTNVGTAQGTLNIYAVDATTSMTSGTAFLDHGQPRRDVGAWTALSLQSVTLSPGESQNIPFRLSIPHQVGPGQHAGGIVGEQVVERSSASAQRQVNVHIEARISLGILVNLPGPTLEKLTVSGIDYNKGSIYQGVLVHMANSGTQLLHPSVHLQIWNRTGQQVQDIAIQLSTFLPRTSILYPAYFRHHTLGVGTYTTHLHVQYEGHHTLDYTTSFVIPLVDSHGNLPPHVISDLVTPDTNIFHALTLWHYVFGIVLLFLLGSIIFLWSRKLQREIVHIKQRQRNTKN